MPVTPKKLDKIYQNYSEEHDFEFKLLKYKTQEIIKHSKGKRLLDIGCGVGIMTQALAPHFSEIVGLDGSKQKINVAKKHYRSPNIEYIYTMFEDYQPSKLFDTAIMTNVLEHMPKPVPFLKQIKTWLKKNGKVVITVPNALAFHKRLGKEMGLVKDYYKLTKADIGKGHFHMYDQKKLASDLTKSGFKVITNSGFFFKPFSSSQMEAYDDQVLDGLYKIGSQYPELCSSLLIVGSNS